MDELLAGTIGVAIALAVEGVDILRVHDVQATRDALSRVCRDSKKMNRRDTRNITAAQDRETGPHYIELSRGGLARLRPIERRTTRAALPPLPG